nr:EAL domain-containing protein [Thalassobacillus pellis]
MEKDNLLRLSRDWAVWDDTYSFINEGDESYIISNLGDDTFSNNQIQYMLFLSDQYEVIHQKGYQFAQDEKLEIEPSFLEGLITEIQKNDGKNRTFFQSNNGKMLMLSTYNVARSDGTEEGNSGVLVMGRMMNDAYIEQIEESLSINLAISPEAAINSVKVTGPNTLRGGMQLQGGSDNSVLQLAITGNRTFYHERVSGLGVQMLFLTLGLCTLSMLLFVIFKYFAINPVSQLSKQMKSIQFDDNFSSRVSISRRINKEIRDLESSINSMLTTLETTHGKVLKMAYYDQLTQLSNRFYLYQEFPRFVKSTQKNTAILFFDLDGFKRVNDTWGHEVGDVLLTHVAERLRNYFSEKKVIISRIGGDEFVVVTTYNDFDSLNETIDEVRELLNSEYALGHIKTYISASIGVSIYPTDGESLFTLLKYADMAMYEAKTNGKNKFVYYHELSSESQYNQLTLLKNEVHFALEKNQLRLVYQPIYSSESHQMGGLEALLRWDHPDKGTIPPDTFIPLMEENGCIHEVGIWVLREGLKQMSEWRDQFHQPLSLSINFSKVQLKYAEDFLDVLDESLSEFRFPPDCLYIEITESDVATYNDDIVYFIRALQQRGVRVAIDDFGVGTSSLYGLRDLPVDSIKIDRSFIQRIPEDSFDASLLAGIYRILNELKIDIVTEGVETEEQLDFIVGNSITKVQGYYFSKPVDPSTIEEMLHLNKDLLKFKG